MVQFHSKMDIESALWNPQLQGATGKSEKAKAIYGNRGKILKAINEVRSFSVLSGGGSGLYDANNALVVCAGEVIITE